MRYVILGSVSVFFLSSFLLIFLVSRFSQRRRLGLGSILVSVFLEGLFSALNAFGFLVLVLVLVDLTLYGVSMSSNV